MGNTFAAVVKVFVIAYIYMIMITFFSYQRVQAEVDNLVYDTAESVSTTGVLSSNMYDGLSDTINRYSIGPVGQRYFIQLKLEKQLQPNTFDVFYESSEDRQKSGAKSGKIVGRPLDVGDRITVYVEDRTSTLLGKLLQMPLVSVMGDEVRVRSAQTAIVAKRLTDAVKGYDVVADLNTNSFTQDNKIVVITKVDTSGREYTQPSSLPSFKTYNIKDVSDPDYIFPSGEFLKNEDIINGEKVVTYVQQY
jgi:hypothetical protein